MAFEPLDAARALVELYAEKGDRRYELADVAQVAALLAERGVLGL